MTTSTERGAIAGTSQTASRLSRLFRHPLWTTGTVVRGLAAMPGPATVRRAVSHLLSRVFPLRLTIPTRRWSEVADSGAAVRWAGPINLRHRTLEALLCLPPGGIEYPDQGAGRRPIRLRVRTLARGVGRPAAGDRLHDRDRGPGG